MPDSIEFNLLQKLTAVFGPSGDESLVKEFIIDHVKNHQNSWKSKPRVLVGTEFQDCIILVFGSPKTAVYTHMDTVGFTARYENQLVPIGSPDVSDGDIIVGDDLFGDIECSVMLNKENQLHHNFARPIARGTNLVYKPKFIEEEKKITSNYLDNRLGVFTALELAKTLENGILAFTCWEEHGGGSVGFISKYLEDQYKIRQALINDITWVTDGVHHGEGAVISLRDHNIPRKLFLNRILEHVTASGVKYQLEVEGAGSSDGQEIQHSPYPIDWCFIGTPIANTHATNETVNKFDVRQTISLYRFLLENL